MHLATAIVLIFCTAAFSQPTADKDEAALKEKIAKLVRKSDAIVVGGLSIRATRDGHVGTIAVREVLYGTIKEKTINFISPPIDLGQDGGQIWFLKPDQGGWRLEEAGIPLAKRELVVKTIEQIKKAKN